MTLSLEECHAFFGQMYEHGVNLPEAGEQHLERVASSVARFLESIDAYGRALKASNLLKGDTSDDK